MDAVIQDASPKFLGTRLALAEVATIWDSNDPKKPGNEAARFCEVHGIVKWKSIHILIESIRRRFTVHL